MYDEYSEYIIITWKYMTGFDQKEQAKQEALTSLGSLRVRR